MNIPQIANIETALEIYYKKSEIGNREISILFGRLSSATICRLKKAVKAEMLKRNICSYSAYKVSTVVAFEVFHINVTDLEKRRDKLKELNLW